MAIQVDLVASGLASPTSATFAPGVADKVFITEKESGRVVVLDVATNQISAQPFFDVPAAEMSSAGEGGLLGLAFHPNFAANGKAYLNLTNESGDTEVWEITRSATDPAVADPSSARPILTIDRSATNHAGGWVGFGPDGFLYIASGDSGGAGDPENAAQNLNDLRGKMLRIDVNSDAFPNDAARNYAIPANNPFANEVFAYGLRNPWRASFDSATGDFYIADVGQTAREEIDFLAAGTGAGTNFGWRVMEGTLPTGYAQLDNPPANDPSLTPPIHEYGRDQGGSIIGGYVYRGPGGLQGEYFFADFLSDHVWTARVVDGEVAQVTLRDSEFVFMNGGTLDMMVSFAEDAQGRLYIIGLDGEVFRLTPTDTPPPPNPGAVINGTSGNDTLSGTSGNDTINGLGGNDVFLAGSSAGNDVIDGGAGFDSIEFKDRATSAVVADFGTGSISGGSAGTISFTNVERVVAGNFDDRLSGNAASQILAGQAGADTLWGAGGADTLWGSGGADTFIFRESGTANADRISDFTSGSDKLVLDGSVMNALGAPGNFAAGDARFAANSTGTAQDASDRIIFNTTMKQVFYDADGNGSAGAVLIATLQSGASLIATDIVVENTTGALINGTSAADTLSGSFGNDTLNGLGGNDRLVGGGGSDTFLFTVSPGAQNADTVIDFTSGADKVVLDGAVHLDAGPGGNFGPADARFHSHAAANVAHDAVQRVLYDTASGELWYDADGSGPAPIELIATLAGAPPLAATDISIIAASGAMIVGTPGDDSLVGGPGNDTLDGGDGFDTMDGGAGDDTYYSDLLADEFNPGDVLIDAAGTDTLITEGGTLPDEIENLILRPTFDNSGGGNSLNNVIRVEPAVASVTVFVDGAGGNDTILGGGDAFIFLEFAGTFGNDSVDGAHGGGVLDFGGAAGPVTLNFRTGAATSSAGSVAFRGVANAIGSSFADQMTASDTGNRILGGSGNDTLIGGAGNDALFGEGGWNHPPVGSGDDSIYGGAGNDFIEGDQGSDTLDGGAGNDTLDGESAELFETSADRFLFSAPAGASNADTLVAFDIGLDGIVIDGTAHPNSGPSGTFAANDPRFWSSTTGMAHDADDRVIYNTSTGELWYDSDGNQAGARELIATLEDRPDLGAEDIEVINGAASGGQLINGTSGNDTLTSTDGNDTINGLGGNDVFFAGSTGGADVMDGGAGFDSIEFKDRATSAVVVDFAAGSISGGSSGTIRFTNVERVVTGNFDDTLSGNASSQTLTGQAGADTLWGAGGLDTLWGVTGADTFVFREFGTANADSIRDWASGVDTIALDNAAMSALGADGDFVATDTRFASNSTGTAQDGSDRVIFNTSTGGLYYDPDGSATGATPQLIAAVQNGASVAATDIVVI